ncbi:MAG: CDP-alcohol phosphatidyltransferase family protein [Nitriliruptoraceae bacterium]
MGGDGGPHEVSDRVLTVPNVVTVARILVLPLLWVDLVNLHLWRALVVLAVFSATDWIDGYLARRLDQVSRLGQLLDPTADRLLLVVIGIAVVVAGLVPWWVVALVVVRDVVMLIGGGLLLARTAGPPPVTRLGKVATFVLMVAFPLFIAASAVGTVADPQGALLVAAWGVWCVGIVLYWAAAGDYARILLRRPSASTRTDLTADTD